jgi:hypothetical protein
MRLIDKRLTKEEIKSFQKKYGDYLKEPEETLLPGPRPEAMQLQLLPLSHPAAKHKLIHPPNLSKQ